MLRLNGAGGSHGVQEGLREDALHAAMRTGTY